jgi:hypothetical protein
MWRRFMGLGAAFLSLFSPAFAAPSTATSAHAAPVAWIQYAKLVAQQFEDRLGGGSTPAQRLRTYLSTGPQPSTTITVSAWVDPKGKVTRVAFAPFLDGQANNDLDGLLQGVQLAQTPPRDMLLPIHLQLHVAASPAVGTGIPAAGSAPPQQH